MSSIFLTTFLLFSSGPDYNDIFKKSFNTANKMRTEAFSWTAIHGRRDKPHYEVDGIKHGKNVKLVLYHVLKKRKKVLSLIMKDGKWYWEEGKRKGIYRPYEAPSDMVSAYFYILRSRPQFVTPATMRHLGSYERSLKRDHVFRTRLNGPEIQSMQQILASYAGQLKSKQKGLDKKAIKTEADYAAAFIRFGYLNRVDFNTGIVTYRGKYGRETEVDSFKWLDKVPEDAFKTEGKWQDFSKPIEDFDNWFLAEHSAYFIPGQPYAADGRLVNAKTGEVRRVPFPGFLTSAGCFSKDRKSIYVPAKTVTEDNFEIYQIPLNSRNIRRMGSPMRGIKLNPTISPDGKKLAFIYSPNRFLVHKSRIMIINIATGINEYKSDEMDCAFLNWTPNSKGLIFQQNKKTNKNFVPMIKYLSPSKGTKTICVGHSPKLINGKLTYIDIYKKDWVMVDKDKKTRTFLKLQNFGFPSVSKDGKSIIMIDYNKKKSPSPVLIDLETMKKKDILKKEKGIWSNPNWH